MEAYEELLKRTREIIQFQSGIGLVRWDLYTQMPPRGVQQRSQQLALMGKLFHRMSTDPEIDRILSKIEANSGDLDNVQKREVELARREYDRYSNLPEDLVSQYSAQKTIATAAWKKAKETNNWKLFESELVTLLDISKQVAEIVMESIGAKCQLDAMMDYWEPRMTVKSISKVFDDLRKELAPLVEKYSAACEGVRMDFVKRDVPLNIQRELVADITGTVGYDTTSENAAGRIDESEHPFTSGYYDDVRLTVKYHTDDVFSTVFGGLHESGHAIQNQNQNKDWKWMYLGSYCSSGFSESQARLVENVIGRSPEFWEFYYPRFKSITNGIFEDITYPELIKAINFVRPSNIRVAADEMTYALHIIIRFEIEQALFEEKMEISEIPRVWNDKFMEYLGVEVETDTVGALQDVHWAWAYWGYFPNYALGNLYAAMIREKMSKDIPQWRAHVIEGKMESPLQWLAENVHKMSNLYNPSEMIKRITGKPLSSKPFIDYIDEKYSALFE